VEKSIVCIEVFDNFLPEKYEKHLENLIFGIPEIGCDPLVSFLCKSEKTATQELGTQISFWHKLVDPTYQSEIFHQFMPVVEFAIHKVGSINHLAAKVYLIPPQKKQFVGDRKHYELHVDRKERHKVVIYYINDSDGATYIYEKDRKTIKEIVEPKKGRMVIFDGDLPHGGGIPLMSNRSVINMNILY
jgi:hypothetical protein